MPVEPASQSVTERERDQTLGGEGTAHRPGRTPRIGWIALGGAVLLVGGCAAVGLWLTRHGSRLHLGSTYPIGGRWATHLTGWALPALALGALTVRYGQSLAGRLRWGHLLVVSVLAAAGWAVALALVSGPAAIAEPLTTPPEYLHDVPRVEALGIGPFLRTFSAHIAGGTPGTPWTTHVAGHPPLATLAFVVLAKIGLGAPIWAAALCIGVGASAAGSVLSTVRVLAGEEIARRAVPFVAVAPAALWIATSADAMFAGVAAAGLCALAHAGARRRDDPALRAAVPPWTWDGWTDPAGVLLAFTGGVLLGACAFLSYGLLLLVPLVIAVLVVQRRPGVLIVAALGALAVYAGFRLAGFDWFSGFQQTRIRVAQGNAYRDRPAGYFVFADPAALAIVVGPAVIVGATALRRARSVAFAAIPVAVLVAIGVAVASTLAKGEVERIYLPFAVWLLPLGALVPARSSRRWLAAQCGWAFLIAITTQLTW